MSFVIKTTTKEEEVASFVASTVLRELSLEKKVLLFLTGGSSISVGVKISEILRNSQDQNLLKNLTITLTDERYGEVNYPESNWYQLLQKGFSLPGAKLIPVLKGEDKNNTIEKFNRDLNEEFTAAEYKIGLFGIGADGHTAGILPESEATQSEELASIYEAPKFSRITMTFRAIERLDEAVAWVQGQNKWGVVENLLKENIDIIKQPAQILKKVPLLTIFSDYKKI